MEDGGVPIFGLRPLPLRGKWEYFPNRLGLGNCLLGKVWRVYLVCIGFLVWLEVVQTVMGF